MRFPRLAPLGLALVLALCQAPPARASDPSNDPRFRADDPSAQRAWDNPALWGFNADFLRVSALWAPVDKKGDPISGIGSGADSMGVADLNFVTPLISYGAAIRGNETWLRAGTAFGPSPSLSFGYQYFLNSASLAWSADMGLAFRPFDFLSFGATLQDAFGSKRAIGLGLGLRPLAPIPGADSILTLTADGRFDSSGFAFETAGARLSLGGSLDLRGWWDFARSAPGLELVFSIGGAETALSTPALSPPWKDLRVSQSLRLSMGEKGPSLLGKRILLIKDLDAVDPAPPTDPVLPDFLTGIKKSHISGLCALIRRAASDASFVAVALEDLPAVGMTAASQELGSAIDALRAAGKKLYVYADAYSAPSLYQVALSKAERISLNPNGQILLVGQGGSRLYFKGLFEKMGLRFINLAPWDTKSANNPLTMDSMPEGERAMLERYLSEIQSQEEVALAAGRGDRISSSAADLVDGGPYMIAAKALDLGLVDAVEYRAEFEKALKDAYPGASFAESLSEGRGTSWGPSPFAKRIAVVWLVGNVVPGEGVPGMSIGQAAAKAIERLREDRSTAGILLRVDSGGGAVLSSDIIADEVRKTVAAGKPVVVSMGDLAASGGYYVSAYASRIFANPGTITGSIGVTGLQANVVGLLDKLGIKSERVGNSRSASFADPTQKPREEDSDAMRDYIMAVYDRFIAVVAEGRKLPAEKVRELGEGQIWIGREALAKGLVDELGGLEEAKAWIAAQVGTKRPEYFDVFPGERYFFGGPSASAARELAAALGLLAKRELAQGEFAGASDSASALAAELAALIGPAAKELARAAAMGEGPLLYCPEAFGRSLFAAAH